MRNLKTVYFLTLLILVGLYSYNQVRAYYSIKSSVSSEIRYYNSLFNRTVQSTLHEVEMLLDSLGRELLRDEMYRDLEKSEKLMKDLLGRADYLVGFGLTDPEGNYIALSSGINKKRAVDLNKNPEAIETFNQTLASDVMVLGKVYLFSGLNQWILPLRKTLRDDSGEIIGVMTTGISVKKATTFFDNQLISSDQTSVIVTENGQRRLLVSPLDESLYEQVYSKDIPVEKHPEIVRELTEKLSMSMEDIKEKEIPLFFEADSEVQPKTVLNSAQYNSRYKIWTITFVPLDTAWQRFLQDRFYLKLIIFFMTIFAFAVLSLSILRKEEETKKQLRHQAIHDPLTQLYNRSALPDIGVEWTRSHAAPFALLYIDLDNFKNINDTFGHSYGDVILIQIADRLKSILPVNSAIFRVGGDEFVTLLKIEQTKIDDIAAAIIEKLSQPYLVEELTLHLGVSIGITRFPDDGSTIDDLLIMADLAMYEAKKKKNAFALYSVELQENMKRKTSIEHHLREALHGDELYMMYQPQVSSDGRLHGAEALVRWKSSVLGFVPPDQFINIAEESGLMLPLGAFIIERTCMEFRQVLDQCEDLAADLSISINISVKQMLENDFKAHLLSTLEKYSIERSRTTIEITESLFIDELDYILPLLNDIRAAGITISLDDFGTGYSSLSMLRSLPIDELKIDRSFIQSIMKQPQDAEMANSIINMGQTLKMKVLAEGIEEEGQRALLNSFGCDLYQGYLFSPPLLADKLVEFIKTNQLA